MYIIIKLNTIIYFLFTFFLPFTAMGQLYPFLGVWAQNASLLFLFIGVINNTFVNIFIYKKKLNFSKLTKIFLLFVVAMYISTIVMSTYFYFSNIVNDFAIIKDSILKLGTLLLIFLSFYYPYSFINKKEDLVLTVKSLYLSLIFLIIYGYMQIYSIFDPESTVFYIYMHLQKMLNFSWVQMFNNYNLSPQVTILKRIILTNQEPSIAAFALQVLFFPFLLSASLNQSSLFKYKKINLEFILLIFSVPLLIFTFSSAGFITFLVQLLICLYLIIYVNKITGKNYIYIPIIIIGLTLIIMLFLKYNNELYSSFKIALKKVIMSGPAEGSAETRYGTIVAGIKEFLQYPIFGVGLGNSKYFLPELLPEWAKNIEVMTYIKTQFSLVPKSIWIRILAETGTFGILPLLYFLYKLTIYYITNLKIFAYKGSYGLLLSSSYLIFITSLFIHGLNTVAFFIIFQWALLGHFVAAIDVIESNKNL